MTTGIPARNLTNEYGTFAVPVTDEVTLSEWSAHHAPGYDRNFVEYLLRDVFPTPESTGTFVDVGAHMGLVCVPIARARPGVSVVAYEPDLHNRSVLEWNLTKNGATAHVMPYALGRTAGAGALLTHAENTHDHRIVPEKGFQSVAVLGEDQGNLAGCSVQILDSPFLLSGVPPGPTVLKLDVQGAEMDVLAGGARFLERVNVLAVEFWPYGLAHYGHTIDDALAVINALGFAEAATFRYPDGRRPERPVFVRTPLAFHGGLPKYDYVDIVLRR